MLGLLFNKCRNKLAVCYVSAPKVEVTLQCAMLIFTNHMLEQPRIFLELGIEPRPLTFHASALPLSYIPV